MNQKVFWLVYVDGGDAPKKRHLIRADAEAEVERLVRKEKRPAYILEAQYKCYPPQEVPLSWERLV